MGDHTYKAGQVVRFTLDNLGAMTDAHAGPKALTEVTMHVGDRGIYVEPSHTLADEGWHVVRVGRTGTDGWGRTRRPLYVPVHASMIEPVDEPQSTPEG